MTHETTAPAQSHQVQLSIHQAPADTAGFKHTPPTLTGARPPLQSARATDPPRTHRAQRT